MDYVVPEYLALRESGRPICLSCGEYSFDDTCDSCMIVHTRELVDNLTAGFEELADEVNILKGILLCNRAN